MKQYIDKNALVAEIERRLSILENRTGNSEVMKRVEGVIKGYKSILSFLDTLEAKEDLETFDKRVTKMWGRCAANPNDTIACLHIDSFIEIARHFYELGLKTKGE